MTGLGRRKTLVLSCMIALLNVLLLCGLCWASGEQEGAHDNGQMLDLLYRVINFSLLVIILFLVIRKTTIKDFFKNRREEIKMKFEDLKTERQAAEGRYRELERKLKEFEIKKREIIEQFRAEGTAERDKIIAEAKKRAEQIVAQADLTIEREIQGAQDRLRQELVDIAAQRAEEIIANEIRGSDQDQLVNEFIERVEKLH